MAWNLALAWIPVALASLLGQIRRFSRSAAIMVIGLWLLFLPNAPYVATDFIHVGDTPGAPLWLDVLLFSAFAVAGLLLGLLSLLIMEGYAHHVFDPTRIVPTVTAVLVLSSLGVTLGRFPQWNSWDVIVNPSLLMTLVGGGVWTTSMTLFALGFAGFQIAIYTTIRRLAFMATRNDDMHLHRQNRGVTT
jgi:uncharacterized membrane protein